MKDMYSITLSGQGDTSYVLFENKDLADWVNHFECDPPQEMIDAYLSDEDVSQDIKEGYLTKEEALKSLNGTSGSWSNDRALSIWDNVKGVVAFVDLKKKVEYCKKEDINIIPVFEGYIY